MTGCLPHVPQPGLEIEPATEVYELDQDQTQDPSGHGLTLYSLSLIGQGSVLLLVIQDSVVCPQPSHVPVM